MRTIEFKLDELLKPKKKKKPKKPTSIVKSFRLKPEAVEALAKLSEMHHVKEPFIINQMLIAAGKSIKSDSKDIQEDKVS